MGARKGHIVTEDTRKKISEKLIGKYKEFNFTKEYMERLYWEDKLSMYQIAKKLKVNYGTIYNWLCRYNIARRTRSDGLKLNYSMKNIINREKVSKALKGRHTSPKTEFTKGHIPPKEWRESVSKALKGKPNYKIRDKNAPNWKGGITPKNKKARNSTEFKEWREKVFKRDNYTCQECHERGGILHPHHIKPFAKYQELRFDANNGITLCKECHLKTESWGVGSGKT